MPANHSQSCSHPATTLISPLHHTRLDVSSACAAQVPSQFAPSIAHALRTELPLRNPDLLVLQRTRAQHAWRFRPALFSSHRHSGLIKCNASLSLSAALHAISHTWKSLWRARALPTSLKRQMRVPAQALSPPLHKPQKR
eukprot:2158586-Pleurochrysis_carterae.AAC.4